MKPGPFSLLISTSALQPGLAQIFTVRFLYNGEESNDFPSFFSSPRSLCLSFSIFFSSSFSLSLPPYLSLSLSLPENALFNRCIISLHSPRDQFTTINEHFLLLSLNSYFFRFILIFSFSRPLPTKQNINLQCKYCEQTHRRLRERKKTEILTIIADKHFRHFSRVCADGRGCVHAGRAGNATGERQAGAYVGGSSGDSREVLFTKSKGYSCRWCRDRKNLSISFLNRKFNFTLDWTGLRHFLQFLHLTLG